MNHPCGTGPYVCTEWEEGDHTSFERNDDYWGDKPGVDTVTIKEVPEAGARTAMLQTGEADFIYPTPSDQIEAIKGTDDVNILTTDSNIMRYVTLNMDLEQLSDSKSTSGYELRNRQRCIHPVNVFRIRKTGYICSSIYHRWI